MSSRSAGTGYVTVPDSGEGPGVLVLHSWWGLTPFFEGVCDRLSEAGFTALAPDLFGGRTVDTPEAAERLLAEADVDAMAHLVRAGLFALHGMPATPDAPVGTLGFSMGGSWALWLAGRFPDLMAATVAFYGTQSIDMTPATSAFLGHFAEHDRYVDDDERTLLEADLHVLDEDVHFRDYPGTGHRFFESDRPASDEAAAALAWDRTLAFLRDRLGQGAGT